ncbi:unnamed protein product, partial [marine sediment metagenome]
ESVYSATVKKIDRYNPSKNNSGIKTKRLYNMIGRNISSNQTLSPPKIQIVEEDGSIYELVFNDMDPLYSVYFLAEDKYGNVYFKFYYYQGKKPQQIHKYNPQLEFLSKIKNIHYSNNFSITQDKVIDHKGNIYIMHLSDLGVQIKKWHLNDK